MSAKTTKGKNSKNWRVNSLLAFIFLLAGLVFGRLFYVSYIQHDSLSQTAQGQYDRKQESQINRGDIFTKGFVGDQSIVATKDKFPYVYLIPEKSKNPESTATILSELFPSYSRESLVQMLSKEGDPFELLMKKVSPDIVKKIEEINLTDVKIGYESGRSYPQKDNLAYISGFMGYKDGEKSGQYGVEGYYEDTLNEEANLVLTIDLTIQSALEAELNLLIKKWEADSGSIIVQDPNSGAIVGIVSSPSYDPNNYSEYSLSRFVNPSTQDSFEPGSTMKTITMAAGLDMGKVNPGTKYEDMGFIKFGNYTIRNYDEKVHGLNTMSQVLEKSLNTGAIFVQKLIGGEAFLNYLENFGFGKKTGVDLAGEAVGNISNLRTGRDINFATASFGQGLSVTQLQLISAYSAVANGGKLMKPYVVDEIIYPNNHREKTKSKIISVPISEKTSAQLKAMLTGVVDNGFGKAAVKGYDVAAKSGTAQVAEAGGYSERFIHDMVGFAPSFSPKFTILIKIDNPKGAKFASDTLSASFGNLSKFLLNYYSIPPTRE